MDALILDLSSVHIQGECSLEGYSGMIEVLSYTHDAAVAKSFTITKRIDVSSVPLMDYCVGAKNIPIAIFTVGENNGGKITKKVVYTMANAVVTSVSVGGGGSGSPQETVQFGYTRISKE